MKRIISILVALTLLTPFFACPPPARAGFGDFIYTDDYVPGQYGDVNEPDWFARYVEDAYNYGFFREIKTETFDPGGLLTFGEASGLLTVFGSVLEHENPGAIDFNSPFSFCMELALYSGIIKDPVSETAPITRLQFAALMYAVIARASFPNKVLPQINPIPDFGICDVVDGMEFCGEVYELYRSGILSGTDQYGTFSPDKGITRAEACAVMVRLVDPLARIKAVPPATIPADVIYGRCMDAVFLLETFDKDGESIRTGTGFFINDTGYAVTNLHVIENAASAEVTLSNGDVFPVPGVVASSEEYNLIIFLVDLGESGSRTPADNGVDSANNKSSLGPGQSYLKLADSDLAVAGSTVYALGNPLAFVHTITNGIVANAYREVDDNIFFQFTAPISFGSGGSPVLNSLGQVVGVASSSFSYGQNLNLAVPSNLIKELEIGECVPLDMLLPTLP